MLVFLIYFLDSVVYSSNSILTKSIVVNRIGPALTGHTNATKKIPTATYLGLLGIRMDLIPSWL